MLKEDISLNEYIFSQVSEMKKTAPTGEKKDSGKTNSASESRETVSQLKEEASSSSASFSEELQGFTSASEIYSVRYAFITQLHFCILAAADYSDINMHSVISLILQLKRKRVGAGQRGSSNPFLAAKDLLKSTTLGTVSSIDSGRFCNDSSGDPGETNTEASLNVTSSIRARASAAAASLNSPTKAGRAMSKKQQKLAEAAKTSRNISHYFAKKQTAEKSQEEVGEVEEGLDAMLSYTTRVVPKENSSQQAHSPVTVKTVGSETPVGSLIEEESKTDVIVIPDEEGDEETCKTQTLEQEQVQNTCEEFKSTTE